jgi:hypothetical protein
LMEAAAALRAQAQGEPVAWQWLTHDTWHTVDKTSVADPETYARSFGLPVRAIYAAPPAPSDAGMRERRFAKFSNEEAAIMPDGWSAELTGKTTRELIADRRRLATALEEAAQRLDARGHKFGAEQAREAIDATRS